MPRWLLFLVVLLLAGCGEEQTDTRDEGGGPLTLRIWDREARARPGSPPSHLVAERLAQRGDDPSRLDLSPVLVRRPLRDGVAYLHAALAQLGTGDGRTVAVPGRVGLSGVLGQRAFAGHAAEAGLAEGGAASLEELRLVRFGALTTVARLRITETALEGEGGTSVGPAPAAIAAALAAIPPGFQPPALTSPRH